MYRGVDLVERNLLFLCAMQSLFAVTFSMFCKAREEYVQLVQSDENCGIRP